MGAKASNRQVTGLRGRKGIPEWGGDAFKGHCRSLTHAEAVAECAELTDQYRRMWHREALGMADLNTILQALQAKKVPFVLTGAHGISSWTGRPRSTHDVDILVKAGRNYARAVKAIRGVYPSLEVRVFFGVTAFFLPGEKESVIDVTYPHRLDLAETLETGIWVEEQGRRYRIPRLEAALANKYGAMLTPNRDVLKRGQDAIDFATMVRHSTDPGRQPIDLDQVRSLGEKVWPGGGGAEILRLIEEVKSGKVLDINSLVSPEPS